MSLDRDRIRTRLEDIARSLDRLKRLQRMDRQAFLADEDSKDIARSRLLTAMEAALNICYHAAAKKLHRVPEEYAQCFMLLGEAGYLTADVSRRLASMARLRNRLVHLYWDVDYGQVYDLLQHHLADLEAFSNCAAEWL